MDKEKKIFEERPSLCFLSPPLHFIIFSLFCFSHSLSLSFARPLALSHTLLISPFLLSRSLTNSISPFYIFFIYLFLSFSAHFLFFSYFFFLFFLSFFLAVNSSKPNIPPPQLLKSSRRGSDVWGVKTISSSGYLLFNFRLFVIYTIIDFPPS
ncbi:unnamed protein product [Acanthosepion pharaonis]|uniref:Transmembrane protein n=1 Tax=Acanthosepion pharaonis TaxID=158019 RepID=A0A812BPG9_ACAPH|nr:unnamed protein product [Sepia pharaonis]